MRTLKITKRVQDTQDNNKILEPGTVIERDDKRAKAFAKYSEDITDKKVKDPEVVKPKKSKKSKK